jgi:hypothetical protein
VRLVLSDPAASSANLIPNGSLEQGLWSKTVGDCNAYDTNSALGMRLSDDSTDGRQSLQLEAQRHTACTTTPKIPVAEAASYLLSFDYKSPNSKQAGYYAQFNDADRTVVNGNLQVKNKNWQHFDKTITTPVGATSMSVTLYAYSDDYGSKRIINRYDNLRLQRIPTATDQYYLADAAPTVTPPAKVDFTLVNPTKKLVHIHKATTPFYLAMSEAYHDKWQLEMNNKKVQGFGSWLPGTTADAVPTEDHFKLDDFLNGWYVDVPALCKTQHLCHVNADGSYDLEMVAEFTPQRWFYFGGVISVVTLLACLGYLGYAWRRKPASKAPEPPAEPEPPTEPQDPKPPVEPPSPPPAPAPEASEPKPPPRRSPAKRRVQMG